MIRTTIYNSARVLQFLTGTVKYLAMAAGIIAFSFHAFAYFADVNDYIEYSYNESEKVVYGPGERPRFDTRRIIRITAHFYWRETLHCQIIGSGVWKWIGDSKSDKDLTKSDKIELDVWAEGGYPWPKNTPTEPALCYVDSTTSVGFPFGAFAKSRTHRTAVFVVNWPGPID